MSDTETPLRPTVTAIIKALFEAKDRETVTEILVEECNAERLYTTSADAVERIQLAVLKLSNGEVDKFLAAAELAQLDWRDVLVASGFGSDLKAHHKWADEPGNTFTRRWRYANFTHRSCSNPIAPA